MPVTITLKGRHYTVRSDEPEEEVVQLARWLDERILEVVRKTPGVDGETVVLLAALNLASEYARFRKRVAEELGEVDREMAAVSAILEVGLSGGEDEGDPVIEDLPGDEE